MLPERFLLHFNGFDSHGLWFWSHRFHWPVNGDHARDSPFFLLVRHLLQKMLNRPVFLFNCDRELDRVLLDLTGFHLVLRAPLVMNDEFGRVLQCCALPPSFFTESFRVY